MHLLDHGAQGLAGIHGLWWFFGLLLLGMLVLYLRQRPLSEKRRARETPQALLKRRLAAGEISVEEYEMRLALLVRSDADR